MSEPHVHGDLDALLDGELDAARRETVEMHVASCAECAAALARARRVARALADVPVPDPGDAYWARFADRVESRLVPDRAPERETVTFYERLWRALVLPGRWGWVGTAGVLVTATLAVYVGMRGYRPQPVSMPNATERAQRVPEPAAPRGGSAPSAPGPAPQGPFEVPTRAPLAASPAPEPPAAAAQAPVEAEPERVATGGELGAAPAGGSADAVSSLERAAEVAPGAESAGRADVPKAPDPVLEFARAALQGSPADAQSRYASLAQDDFAALPAPDAALLRAWHAPGAEDQRLDAESFPQPAAKVQRPQGLRDQKQAADAGLGAPALAPAPPRAQLQILDALVWPRREAVGGREAVASLAQAWQRTASEDPQARARVRELATWLADTSPSGDEKARWEALRDAAAER